jgi:protein SCO1
MGRRFWRSGISAFGVLLFIQACSNQTAKELPVLGPYKVVDNIVDGRLITDTLFTQIRPFIFYDQDGEEITEKTIEGKVCVVDFFFTSCPTICPKMKQQMLRIYDEFENEPDLVLLSHSIDPKRDSVERLHEFAQKLNVEVSRWHFMTGDRDSIYSMAKHYMIAAQKDDEAPGGFAHSGAFLLVDKNRQIRGIYDGVDPESIDLMMDDIRSILIEKSVLK